MFNVDMSDQPLSVKATLVLTAAEAGTLNSLEVDDETKKLIAKHLWRNALALRTESPKELYPIFLNNLGEPLRGFLGLKKPEQKYYSSFGASADEVHDMGAHDIDRKDCGCDMCLHERDITL